MGAFRDQSAEPNPVISWHEFWASYTESRLHVRMQVPSMDVRNITEKRD
jgi:hypothetical protein